jgi:hypothetical protein
MRATCPAHVIRFDLICLLISGDTVLTSYELSWKFVSPRMFIVWRNYIKLTHICDVCVSAFPISRTVECCTESLEKLRTEFNFDLCRLIVTSSLHEAQIKRY